MYVSMLCSQACSQRTSRALYIQSTFLQARDMAEYLGISADSESGLMDIARMAVAAPIPPGWQQLDSSDGFAVFRFLPFLYCICCIVLASLPPNRTSCELALRP